MNQKPLFIIDAATGCITVAASIGWLAHRGYDSTGLVLAGALTVALAVPAYAIRWRRMQSAKPSMTEEFPKRLLIKTNVIGIGFFFLFALQGWGLGTLAFLVPLLFVLGNLAFVARWLVARHLLRQSRAASAGPGAAHPGP